MGCCRGRPKTFVPNQTPECQGFEASGARTVVRVVATDQGLRLVIPTPTRGFLDLGSFLTAFRCEGATAKLLRRYLPVIQQALSANPAAFASYRSGINITDLIRVAEQATKGARHHEPASVHVHPA